jgi:hypothetical protein
MSEQMSLFAEEREWFVESVVRMSGVPAGNVIRCVTCREETIAVPKGEVQASAMLVKAGWRRVVGGWRGPVCIRREVG